MLSVAVSPKQIALVWTFSVGRTFSNFLKLSGRDKSRGQHELDAYGLRQHIARPNQELVVFPSSRRLAVC